MHCTGFSKRIHRSVQLISVCLSSANQINPQLAYASVDLSPKLPGGGGKASSTIPLIPQLALFLQLTASVKERAQTHNWGGREMVEPRTLNFELTLTAAERNTTVVWWGLEVFLLLISLTLISHWQVSTLLYKRYQVSQSTHKCYLLY